MTDLAGPVLLVSRQVWIFVALGMLAFASLLASIAAWVLLWRDHKARREGVPGAQERP